MTKRTRYPHVFVIALVSGSALLILIGKQIHSQDVIPYGRPVTVEENKEGTAKESTIQDKQPAVKDPPLGQSVVSISQPKARGKVLCLRGADGIYRFSASADSFGLPADEYVLLLWVEPVSPSSETPGWYLQRPPINGIHIATNGLWTGLGQIGNLQWPPHEGDLFNVAVSAIDRETARNLLDQPGVVVRSQPVGMAIDTALNVVVAFN